MADAALDDFFAKKTKKKIKGSWHAQLVAEAIIARQPNNILNSVAHPCPYNPVLYVRFTT
eukprot:4323951-Amphidinium_carterae.2